MMMPSKHSQQGAVLIASLMLLLVMTLLGVTSMRSNTMQERMSGNQRDQNLAFQAAEAGMRDAESFIEGIVSVAAFDGTLGLYGEANTEPDYLLDATWVANNSRAYSATLANVSSQPRYIIKYLGQTGGSNNVGIGNYGAAQNAATHLFRITVRGNGGSDRSQVFLQSHYGRRF